jgi:hypothetical protein
MTIVMRAVLALVLMAGVAHADETSVLVLGGLNVGASRRGGETGFLVGGELSVPIVNFSRGHYFSGRTSYIGLPTWPVWAGIYTDLARDTGAGVTSFTLGPEVGYGPFGIDGGLAVLDGKGGWCVRPVLSLGLVSLYARVGQVQGNTFSQFGVLLKWGAPLVVKSDD